MSAALALIFLAEAATACGAVAPTRLGGGAEVVPAILDFESQPFDPSAPTPAGLGEPPVAVPADARPGTDRPDADPAAAQCKATPAAIA